MTAALVKHKPIPAIFRNEEGREDRLKGSWHSGFCTKVFKKKKTVFIFVLRELNEHCLQLEGRVKENIFYLDINKKATFRVDNFHS